MSKFWCWLLGHMWQRDESYQRTPKNWGPCICYRCRKHEWAYYVPMPADREGVRDDS